MSARCWAGAWVAPPAPTSSACCTRRAPCTPPGRAAPSSACCATAASATRTAITTRSGTPAMESMSTPPTRRSPPRWPAHPCPRCRPAARLEFGRVRAHLSRVRGIAPIPRLQRTSMDNPLLDFSGLPRFDAIRPEHIGPAIDVLLEQAGAAVKAAQAVSPVTWDSFVTPLEDATERLWRAWGQVVHLQAVVNTPELREAYNANLPKV